MLPRGVADGLGDDAQLSQMIFTGKMVVYFPNTPDDLASLQRWYSTLEILNRHYGLIVVVQDSRVATLVAKESLLEVVNVALYATLDAILARSAVEMALYLTDHPWNFSMLRFTSLVHVVLLDDIETAHSVGNQVKAYDYCIARTSESVDRLRGIVERYDFGRCLVIGKTPLGPSHEQRWLIAKCDMVLALRRTEWARVTKNGAIGP